MRKLSICAETMYKELPIEERIAPLAENGVDTIELWQWHNKNLGRLRIALDEKRVRLLGFCVDSSKPDISRLIAETALNGGNEEALVSAVLESIEAAKYLGASSLIITVGDCIEGMSRSVQTENVLKSLKRIMGYFEKAKITLLAEPINRSERPAYLMPNVRELLPIIAELNSEYVKLLYDVYHQSMENDFDTEGLRAALPYIGHIHAADCPGRGEPGTGSIAYGEVFDMLEREKYGGYVGIECFPQKSEERVLAELLRG